MFGEWWFSQTKTYSFDQAFFKWDVDPFHPGPQLEGCVDPTAE